MSHMTLALILVSSANIIIMQSKKIEVCVIVLFNVERKIAKQKAFVWKYHLWYLELEAF